MNVISLSQAVDLIRQGMNVYLPGNASSPLPLITEINARDPGFQGVQFISLLQAGNLDYQKHHFRTRSLFLGAGDRAALGSGKVDYVPVFLSEIPKLLRSGKVPIDIAFVHVSPPDEHGYMSLGTEVIGAKAAVETAKTVIALVNPHMPRVHGDSFVHLSQVQSLVSMSTPLQTLADHSISEAERRIGQHVASLIHDGDTLQLGIGAIPDAVLQALKGKQHLGLHTELISNSVLWAVQQGIVTGSKKSIHPEKILGTLMYGSEELYQFANDNPAIEMHPSDYVNNPVIIAQNKNMVAVNSALEVDVTGQVCADSIGTRMYSGFGGQLDFIRGANMSENGRAIIALTATARVKGQEVSRLVNTLKPGSGVVTTRGDVRYVVTEYGIADLFGKTLSERAEALIGIAHPQFREELQNAAMARGLLLGRSRMVKSF